MYSLTKQYFNKIKGYSKRVMITALYPNDFRLAHWNNEFLDNAQVRRDKLPLIRKTYEICQRSQP
jgi:hypothetical protein